MRIDIVHPLARVGNTGNRTTALRLARMLGPHHAVRVRPRWRHGHSDVLIALHALRSQASIAAWKRAHPRGRLIVVLTGTDIYGAGAADARTQASLEHAWRIVALQADAAARVPADLQAKTRVILQSAVLPPWVRRIAAACPAVASTEVVALSHLRAVKDPLLLPQALQRLDSQLVLTAVHLGGSLDPHLADAARAIELSSPSTRWRWLGERTRCAALRRLARARALVLTSRQEGGPSVLAEAALLGRPILATRVGGAVGMLGQEHPGLYNVGDSQGLAAVLTRLATDTAWVEDMAAHSRALAARFDPLLEQQLWEQLLREPPPS